MLDLTAITDADERQAVELTVLMLTEGGPSPFPRDGTEFRNRENYLPLRAGGYYFEYTVPTPGLPGRGARRLVAGKAGEFYYSRDYYGTFIRLR